MKLQGAVVKEQGVTFAIVIVKMGIVDSSSQSQETMRSLSSIFLNMPIILMAQDSRGIPKYRGRQDIINFLANLHISQIPWKEYTIN